MWKKQNNSKSLKVWHNKKHNNNKLFKDKHKQKFYKNKNKKIKVIKGKLILEIFLKLKFKNRKSKINNQKQKINFNSKTKYKI